MAVKHTKILLRPVFLQNVLTKEEGNLTLYWGIAHNHYSRTSVTQRCCVEDPGILYDLQ